VGEEVIYYEHIATVRHKATNQFFVAFKETMELQGPPDHKAQLDLMELREQQDLTEPRVLLVLKVIRVVLVLLVQLVRKVMMELRERLDPKGLRDPMGSPE